MVRSASSATVSSVIASGFAYCGDPPCPDCARNHADRAQRIQRAALEVLAGDVFQRLPASPKIDAVADFGIARNRANLRVEEVWYQAEIASLAITVSASMPTKISSSS